MARYLATIEVTTEGFRGMLSNPENRQETTLGLDHCPCSGWA